MAVNITFIFYSGSAAQEACWMKQVLTDLCFVSSSPMVIYEDNQSAICMTKNQLFHGRTKHIYIKYFICELVAEKVVEIVYCPTEVMIADILTKGLTQVKFERLREMIGVKQPDHKWGVLGKTLMTVCLIVKQYSLYVIGNY